MAKKIFRVRVPASVANLGPGFDCIGAALTLHNEVEVSFNSKKPTSVTVEIEGEGEGVLPHDDSNIVLEALKRVFKTYKKTLKGSLHLKLINNIPLAAGLGSSAAARLSGIIVGYRILGRKISCNEVLSLGMKLEGHPDNLVPAMIGGLCVSALVDGNIRYIRLKSPKIKVVVCIPYFELPTVKARKILPKTVPFKNAVFNVSRSMMTLASLMRNRFDMLNFAMQDRLHQPYRQKLIPGMRQVMESARACDAYGVALSGAGPSILAFSSISKAEKIGRSMRSAWKQFGINSRSLILDFDKYGASSSGK